MYFVQDDTIYADYMWYDSTLFNMTVYANHFVWNDMIIL